ncbi:uncharacterized protein ASPGLDRAFT_49415 [Aspergillus glaucus CBS 516.65]|uniref:Uncharacterized protein n=1 Tax=Aspergillus glaucus CBS 516.65 TaxID=1160497 RepID=A0A1L9VDL5_ASPGL|nr:hypothetical protein ASPGLDRAFT_49415 [Aspergillus glaucus CBS 516.65]OJJ82027.1 hypothetical protein ASPGLDRAFT_49415 [Aspergillus glaucus CBS 516.65]
MFSIRPIVRQGLRFPKWTQIRSVTTLDGRPYIYVFPNEVASGESHVLSLLPSKPTNSNVPIGITSKLPPTPESFKENPGFLSILQEVILKYAHEDPDNISQAQMMISTSGANLSSGGVLLTGQKARRRQASADSSGGASGQGGAGGAGRGGWIHVFDERRPPEYGRIPWPEDIFGSLEVDGEGKFVDGNGNYQPSGTYRTITRDGIIAPSPFLRKKLVQRLHEIESQ